MHTLKRAAFVLLCLFAAWGLRAAYSQTVVPGALSGNECWNAGQGPGGPSTGFVCTYMLNNTQGVALNTGASAFTVGPTVSDIILTAQPVAAANISTPILPLNGQILEVINGTTSAFATNVFSIIPSGSQTIQGGSIALTTLGAGASRELRYVLSTNTWYPVR